MTTTVKNVNSALPYVNLDRNVVIVEFNETLFDVNAVMKVVFYSNCTTSLMVDYENPAEIPLPDTSMNSGQQCQYALHLIDGNLQRIGYPVKGTFLARGIMS